MTITIKHYIDAAVAKGWHYEWVDEVRNVIAIYPPNEDYPIIIRNNVTELATGIGSVLANYKNISAILAKKVGFQVPEELIIEEHESYQKVMTLLKKYQRLVVKPMDAAFGNGVSVDITDEKALKTAVELARKNNVKSEAVIVQEFCEGNDYRLFILDGQVVAAIERVPFALTGDGHSTIEQLLDHKIAAAEAREDNQIKSAVVTKQDMLLHLKRDPSYILPTNDTLVGHGVANLSRGGEAKDVTDEVHPQVAGLAIELSKLLKLDMCAVDILSQDIASNPHEVTAYFIEANFAPGFRGHSYPAIGKKRELAPLILDVILKKRQMATRP